MRQCCIKQKLKGQDHLLYVHSGKYTGNQGLIHDTVKCVEYSEAINFFPHCLISTIVEGNRNKLPYKLMLQESLSTAFSIQWCSVTSFIVDGALSMSL